jgi:hypothetical protein
MTAHVCLRSGSFGVSQRFLPGSLHCVGSRCLPTRRAGPKPLQYNLRLTLGSGLITAHAGSELTDA